MDTFLDRLIQERDDLAEKLAKLRDLLIKQTKPEYISEKQWFYLQSQHHFMYGYLAVLNDRLKDLGVE